MTQADVERPSPIPLWRVTGGSRSTAEVVRAPPSAAELDRVLARYRLTSAQVQPLSGGLSNLTYKVEQGGARYVLQRLHPVFPAEAMPLVALTTRHLRRHGLRVPRLLPDQRGQLWWRGPDGLVWRLVTFIAGDTHLRTDDSRLCAEAGQLLGRTHRSLVELGRPALTLPPPIHAPVRHLRHLASAIEAGREQPAHLQVCELARRIFDLARTLEAPSRLEQLPRQLVHGDPKLANVLFDPAGRAISLVDLDDVGWMSRVYDLADALRSWCNPRGGDAPDARFEPQLMAAALEGYRCGAGDLLTPEEVDALPRAIEGVTLELASRYAADALEQVRFGWDPRRHPTLSQHNLERARARLNLLQAVRAQRVALAEVSWQQLKPARWRRCA